MRVWSRRRSQWRRRSHCNGTSRRCCHPGVTTDLPGETGGLVELPPLSTDPLHLVGPLPHDRLTPPNPVRDRGEGAGSGAAGGAAQEKEDWTRQAKDTKNKTTVDSFTA